MSEVSAAPTSNTRVEPHSKKTSICFEVYQGEREIASQNKLLGKLNLENIPIAPKGVPKVQVTFELDANGILHVSAMDQGTQKRISTTIQAKGGLNEYQINEPGEILKNLNKQIGNIVRDRSKPRSFLMEGMEISICKFIPSQCKLQYATANTKMLLIRKKESSKTDKIK